MRIAPLDGRWVSHDRRSLRRSDRRLRLPGERDVHGVSRGLRRRSARVGPACPATSGSRAGRACPGPAGLRAGERHGDHGVSSGSNSGQGATSSTGATALERATRARRPATAIPGDAEHGFWRDFGNMGLNFVQLAGDQTGAIFIADPPQSWPARRLDLRLRGVPTSLTSSFSNGSPIAVANNLMAASACDRVVQRDTCRDVLDLDGVWATERLSREPGQRRVCCRQCDLCHGLLIRTGTPTSRSRHPEQFAAGRSSGNMIWDAGGLIVGMGTAMGATYAAVDYGDMVVRSSPFNSTAPAR